MDNASIQQVFIQGGVFALVLGLLWRGTLATRQEIEAWKSRTERAENQVDSLLDKMEKQTEAIRALATMVQRSLEELPK